MNPRSLRRREALSIANKPEICYDILINEVMNMIFPTASLQPRPVRLSARTRDWAWRSMHGEFGNDAKTHMAVSLDHLDGFDHLTEIDQYDIAIQAIARHAPLRLCPEELLCGAATLGNGIIHHGPAEYHGKPAFECRSHLTQRLDKVVREGLDAYKADIATRLMDPSLTDEQRRVILSLDSVIEAIRIWHGRYLAATEADRPDLHVPLMQVPFGPATNFREAMQSIWFIFAFTRLCGYWPGIGRLDWLAGPYLEADLAAGRLTLEEAREIMASFFIKGCEWILSDTPQTTGDAQHYQNLVLAGVDEDGREVTNTVTYLALDIVEELGISDYPITMRLNSHTPEKLLRRIAEVMRHGGGIVALYNEPLILRALEREGYSPREARRFANDGCWEIQMPGRTNFSYSPFDGLQILNRVLGVDDVGAIPAFPSAEAIYQAYLAQLKLVIDDLYKKRITDVFEERGGRWRAIEPVKPSSVVSLFEEGCLEKGQFYDDLGPDYTLRSPHIGGAPDVANSLHAIDQLVFREKKVTFEELIGLLRRNWEGAEALRQYVRTKYTYYGNDTDEADQWHTRLLNDFADLVHACGKNRACPVKFTPGVSTFGRQIDWLPNRTATAFGYRKGDILAGNDSPTPGTDCAGATAMIKSHCKADLVRQSCGAALDVKILPATLAGENGVEALVGLMRGFMALDGFFLQLDAVEVQTLLDAQRHPENYKTLSVRVSGWNARFVTLNREWQEMIIQRNAQAQGM